MGINFTRGEGMLENFLAVQRARLADSQIADHLRRGRILDVGCGFRPYFLSTINFQEKFGLDKNFFKVDNINLIQQDVEKNNVLPFVDNYFEVVTALAFLEHLEAEIALKALKEIYRILKPGGLLIITVPRKEIDLLLKFMAKIKLVSAIEINEHKQLYSKAMIKRQLIESGFKARDINIKSFEFGLNLFAVGKK